MDEIKKRKRFDLEDRSYKFAERCRNYLSKVPKSFASVEYIKQLARSSASVAANYIEANESLSRKDYFHRVRICRKEAKESRMWLKLIEVDDILEKEREKLVQESFELTRIFGAILEKQKS